MTDAPVPGDAPETTPNPEITPAPTPETPPSPEPAPKTPTGWRDGLPDELKNSPSLLKFDGNLSQADALHVLAKSYDSSVKMLGADKIVVPKEGDVEGWDKFYKAAGLPDKPEGYGFKPPEKIPEGFQYDEAIDNRLAGMMHKARVDPRQASVLREELMAMVAEGAMENVNAAKASEAAREVEIQRGLEALKGEWGSAFEPRSKVAGAAINEFLSPETIAAMEAVNLANNPAVIKDMYALGVKLKGEKQLIGEAEQLQTPADIDTAIAEFRTKHSAALTDRSHHENVLRSNELTKLFERKFAGQ